MVLQRPSAAIVTAPSPPKVRVALRDRPRLVPGARRFMQVGLEVSWRNVVKGWPEDLRADFEERAAIMEFDGGAPREEAERRAYEVIRTALDAARFMGGGR